MSNVSCLEINLCQKLFFLQDMGRTCCVQKLFWLSETISVQNMFSPGLSLEFSCKYWTCNSMNNLLSYCGLVNAKIRASDKDLPLMSLDTLEVRVSFTVLPTYLRTQKTQRFRWHYPLMTYNRFCLLNCYKGRKEPVGLPTKFLFWRPCLWSEGFGISVHLKTYFFSLLFHRGHLVLVTGEH